MKSQSPHKRSDRNAPLSYFSSQDVKNVLRQPGQPSQNSVRQSDAPRLFQSQKQKAYEPLSQHYHPSRQTALFKSPTRSKLLDKAKPLYTVNDFLDFKPPKSETPQPALTQQQENKHPEEVASHKETSQRLLIQNNPEQASHFLQTQRHLTSSPPFLKLALVGCQIDNSGLELLMHLPQCRLLQELNLRNNEIQTLPEAIFRMRRLQSLKLDHNRIAELPPIHQVSILKVLTLAHNQLFCVPASIRNLKTSLIMLSLSDNKICFLPPELAELKRLHRLHIDCNQFTKFPCVIMTELEKLKEFSLDWFRYAYPVMSPKIRQKDPFGPVIITYLRNICSNLLRYGRKDFSFITFLEIYATTASSPTLSPSISTHSSNHTNTPQAHDTALADTPSQNHTPSVAFSDGSSTIADSREDPSVSRQEELGQSLMEGSSLQGRFSPGLSPIGEYINKRDNRQRTALHRAAAENHIGVLQALLEQNANLDLLDKEQLTPLCLAIREGNAQCAHMLLVHGADVNIGGGLFGSPLHMAVSKSEVWMVVAILKKGADPNVVDSQGNTPLHQVMKVFSKKAARSAMIAQHLVRRGAKPDAKNNDLWAPIHLATKNAQVDALRWILEINQQHTESQEEEQIYIDVNLPGGAQRHTSLHLASFSGHFDIVEMLVDSSFCDIFQRNYELKTARQLCQKNITLCKIFIKAQERYKRTFIWNNLGAASLSEAMLFQFALNFKRSLERETRLKKNSSFTHLKSRPRKAHSMVPGGTADHKLNTFADVKGFQNYHRQDQAYSHLVRENRHSRKEETKNQDKSTTEAVLEVKIMSNPFYLKDKFYDEESSLLGCYEAISEFEKHCREGEQRWIASFKDLLSNLDQIYHRVVRLDLINHATLLGYGSSVKSASQSASKRNKLEVDSLNAMMKNAVYKETQLGESEVSLKLAYELINAQCLSREVEKAASDSRRPSKLGPYSGGGKIQQISSNQGFPHNGRQPAQAGIHSLSTLHKSVAAGGELRTPKATSSISHRNFTLTASRSQVHKTPKLSRAQFYFGSAADAQDTEPSQYLSDLQKLEKSADLKIDTCQNLQEQAEVIQARFGGPLERLGPGMEDDESVRTPSPEDESEMSKPLRQSKSNLVLHKARVTKRRTMNEAVSAKKVKAMRAHFISPAVKIRCVKNMDEDESFESMHYTEHGSVSDSK